ncbi:phosphatidylinositol-4-phosphate 5-kinase-like protein [Leptomonas pyrrhocoris]|uniref:Phosphatidylinositol-4-phosphate 5-kinase-like protein n=1 Tax=Leptomonas pyrrhocoris TaxID=157538 RepID=A0A0N0VD27_LEPPY|nr:phosphatidylinositol-4-phosphate 5-kinase-like protein [Leptomonas pyrrhocoris]KPA74502.1 phosphatidylinositol-4-phosphate 5-kinase-like protein [Leptomonas pyrrhocoris]|eukprot:XP_015652941.1 phosphatidylinositol-4-phosphate 5-kinase-like protein [Leptomonas pyrrhocoris]
MAETAATTSALRLPLVPTPPPASADKPNGVTQDSALKKKKKLLNGANIRFTFPSGATYEGGFKDGKIEGYGVYTYAQTGDVYAGEWKADLKHGQGSYKFANGDRYIGQWYMGNKHGKGQFAFANGDEYVGSWRDNQMNGYGIFHLEENDDRYEGYWKGGLRQGKGVLRHGNGDLYDGEWDAGRECGLGVFCQSNGDLYCGEWKDGEMDGKGVLREKGIVFLVEYVGGYLISKLKLTEATDELEEGWSAVYNHFLKWLDERETVSDPEKGPAAADKMKDELEAAHAENSVLRKRLEGVMQLLQSKTHHSDERIESSSTTPSPSAETVAAAYFRDNLQRAEAKVKLLECTLAERAMEIRKLSDLVSSSEAKIKELEIGRANRKSVAYRSKGKMPVANSKLKDHTPEATDAASDSEQDTDDEISQLKMQNTLLLQLNDDLQRKVTFLSAVNSRLDVKREAAEEQYEKLSEELAELRTRKESIASSTAASSTKVSRNPSQLLSHDQESPVALSIESTASMGVDELQKRLVQSNQLNIELRIKNGELQQKLDREAIKTDTAAYETAVRDLTKENETFRSVISKLKQQVALLQSTSEDVEQRLFVSTQQGAELEAAIKTMSKEKSADPQLLRVLEAKSDQIEKLQLENAELARLLDEKQIHISDGETTLDKQKQQMSAESAILDDDRGEQDNLRKEVKKLQKRVKKVTAERNAIAEQFYDSQIHLARTHRALGSMHGQIIIFASLFDMETGNRADVESVLRIDDKDPSRMVLSDCGEEVAYKFDYCFGKDATAPQILSEVRDALSYVWCGFQFGLITVGEFRSGKTTLVTQLFPLLVQCLLRAAEEDTHFSRFSYTYRVAMVEVSACGGYDCAAERAVTEICRDSNGYVHPKNVRFFDCTSVSISAIVGNLLSKRRQHYNGRSHTWIQLQCVRTGLAQQSQTVGRLTLFDWCGPGPLSLQKTDIESARFANASSQALKDLSEALSAESVSVPYTRSLETALLFDLLGGNSITAVIGRLRAAPDHIEESMRTLGVLSSLFGARSGPLFQDNQTHDEIRWRGLVGAFSSDDEAERELKAVENTREF